MTTEQWAIQQGIKPTTPTPQIHLSDLLGKLHAIDRKMENEWASLTDSQREDMVAQLNSIEEFHDPSGWEYVVFEISKKSVLTEKRIADYSGMVNLGVLNGVEETAAIISNLHDEGLTSTLLRTLHQTKPKIVEQLNPDMPFCEQGSPDA